MNYKTITAIFLFAGACFALGGIYLYVRTDNFTKRAISVEGEVIALERAVGSKSYFPVVRYKDHLHRERTLYSSAGSSPPGYFVGEKVNVLLDPNDPRYPLSAKIDSFFQVWGASWFLIGFGGFFIFISLVVRYVMSKGGIIYLGKDGARGESST